MFRKVGLVILITALAVTACGRQITPDRPGTANGLSSGDMSIKFTVGGPLDFSTYQYAVVFDTAGSTSDPTQVGVTPSTQGQNTNYAGYSYAIVLTNVGNQVTPTFIQYIRPLGPNIAPTAYICPTGSYILTTLNSNGLNTQFTLIFPIFIFDGCAPFAAVSPGATATPTSTASASPTGSPTTSSSGSPTAVPTANSFAPIWSFNAFSLQQTSGTLFTLSGETIVDSLGTNGANDTSFVSPPLDTTTPFDQTITVLGLGGGGHPPQTSADALFSVEIANSP